MSVEDLEAEAGGGVALALLAVLGVLVLVLVLKWRNTQVPAGLYPYTVAGNVATGVNDLLNAVPYGSQLQPGFNHFAGGVISWLRDHLPQPPVSGGSGGPASDAGGGISSGDYSAGDGPAPTELDQVNG